MLDAHPTPTPTKEQRVCKDQMNTTIGITSCLTFKTETVLKISKGMKHSSLKTSGTHKSVLGLNVQDLERNSKDQSILLLTLHSRALNLILKTPVEGISQLFTWVLHKLHLY